MQLFTVRIETRRQRIQRIAATNAETARRLVAAMLPDGDRIAAVTCEGRGTPMPPDLDLARDVLQDIAARDFLDLDGQPACVQDWLLAAGCGRADELNPVLAVAGLRVLPEHRLAVGSAQSIPMLGEWCDNTRAAGPGLLALLSECYGRQTASRTFAGVRSRCAIVPLADAVPLHEVLPGIAA